MAGLSETERLLIRNSALVVLTDLGEQDNALATVLSHGLRGIVERIIAARVAEHEAREARVRALADQWERGIAALLPVAGSFKQADKLDGSLATLIGASNDLKRALDGGE